MQKYYSFRTRIIAIQVELSEDTLTKDDINNNVIPAVQKLLEETKTSKANVEGYLQEAKEEVKKTVNSISELKEQINKLKEVTDRNIHDTILENVKDKKRAEHLFQILVSRKEYILKHGT